LEKVEFFRHRKSGRQRTTSTTHSTTFSPQKHHNKTPQQNTTTKHANFQKTPAKTAFHHPGKK
jgi:hypothetical protein